jgi:hypothetical protein
MHLPFTLQTRPIWTLLTSQPDQSPRPKGSDRYEDLPEGAKSEFILSILIPETLIRLEILINGQDPKLLAKSEMIQYKKAVERLKKRGSQTDPWEFRQWEAQTAMGLFSMPKSREDVEWELEAAGTHYKSFAGTERLVKLVNYNEQERRGRRTKGTGGKR